MSLKKDRIVVTAESDNTDESEEDMVVEETNNDSTDTETETHSSNNEESEGDQLISNEGWADCVTKILGSNKPKNKKTLVLSRAKKYSEIIKKKQEEKLPFEVVGDGVKQDKSEIKQEEVLEKPSKQKKASKPSIRTKPNVLDSEKERQLKAIATKGVVQLFNAVRNHQKTLEKDMNHGELSETKKEKILKKFDKRAFLDKLMGPTKSINVDEQINTAKQESNTNAPKWNALRDDFMMGAKMKDWDKESVDE